MAYQYANLRGTGLQRSIDVVDDTDGTVVATISVETQQGPPPLITFVWTHKSMAHPEPGVACRFEREGESGPGSR